MEMTPVRKEKSEMKTIWLNGKQITEEEKKRLMERDTMQWGIALIVSNVLFFALFLGVVCQ